MNPEFDSIRPFEPEELPGAYDRLLSTEQFCHIVSYIFPEIPMEKIGEKMRQCKTSLEFQIAFCYPFLEWLLKRASLGCGMDASAVDNTKRYTFISNHRDIVLDSAFLDKLLIDAGFTTTCEIAIGDNLLSLPWVKDFVRLNKSFIVERSLQPRQMLMASKRLSEYMHYAMFVKNENIWIAQREGRAKDSDDRTQPAILKMMAMGGTGTAVERLLQLHLVPLAISYEFDPCDYLKAAEFQLKRDVSGWKKTAQDDVNSMYTGIMGFKGHIHYHCAPCIDQWLLALDKDMPKTEMFDAVAAHIDRHIHANYKLYPNNYIAAEMLDGGDMSGHYTQDERAAFGKYIDGQLAKIDIPGKDEGFLRECMLTMYANPLRNKVRAAETDS